MRVAADRLETFGTRLLAAAGADPTDAALLAANLVWCDSVGRTTHGTRRLPILVRRLQAGLFTTPCRPGIEARGPSLAVMDGANGLGPVVAGWAMDHAVDLARETGVGLVFVRSSNWFGAGAPLVQRAAAAGMMGFAASNSVPKVAATGGRRPVLGTNPLALGAPRRDGDTVLIDMATSGMSGSALRRAAAVGGELAPGLAVDREGRPTLDPRAALEGALLPFGGAKGFALSLAVEIVAGVATGAAVGEGVRSLYGDFEGGGDNGHLLGALDVERLMPRSRYFDRLEALLAWVRSSGDDDGAVLVPGERRWRSRRETGELGIVLPDDEVRALRECAAPFGLDFP